MPYRCVHCSVVYEDSAEELMRGCSNCKSKFFFYIKPEKLKEIAENEREENFTKEEKEKMEKDIREIVGITNEEKPVFLDFESIKVIRHGKYLIDLPKLFDLKKPRVYSLEDGKYIIDLNVLMKPSK
ncbi:MAG: Zn-ribbon domain-containing protein [Candidatus Pacearchaeota archaeon]|nr:Zn-ribbon domain-containing protein [Candidatus Pacearchaeota archaeon]